MKLLVPTALLFATLASAQHGVYYWKCRCMSINNGGKAAGVKQDDHTKTACDKYYPPEQQQFGSRYSSSGDCLSEQIFASDDPSTQILGDTWWDYCVEAGAQSGQCDKFPS